MMTKDLPEKIADPLPPEDLHREIQALNSPPLTQQGPFDVYWEYAEAIPTILLEIGRLRELTFRSVGVGVGKTRDNDEHDDFYCHLFLWDRENHRIAGGYRIARTDQVFPKHGFKGLYTGTLVECDKPLMDYLEPALELGRSWIQPDYQRSMHSLLGLWKGIGHFVARHPRYYKLFGAVTISDDYASASQDLMVRFLRRTKTDQRWNGAMRALLPFQHDHEDRSEGLTTIEEVSERVISQEEDGKGVPVLLRQYFKLNATLLEFAYDANFGDCLDALVLVDLRKAPPGILKKYMGKEGYESFAAEMAKLEEK